LSQDMQSITLEQAKDLVGFIKSEIDKILNESDT